VLFSLGQSKRYFTFGIINSIVIVISFILGLPWGAIGVAVAYTIATYVLLVPMLWYCFRRSPISITDFFSAVYRPAVASLTMALAMLLAHSFLVNQREIVAVCTNFTIGFSAYFLVWSLIPGGIQILRDFHGYVALIFTKIPKNLEII